MQNPISLILLLPLTLSAVDIDAAVKRGETTPVKELWKQIKKRNQYRINRAGFDPIEKTVLFLWDEDRIAMEVAEAKRQMRPISASDIRKSFRLGIVDVLLSANCYNNLYSGSLTKWTSACGVHLILKSSDGRTIQPGATRSSGGDAVTVLPVERGLVTRNGNMITYVPLYRSAFYERSSDRAWFEFSMPDKPVSLSAIVIAGDGRQKEKLIRFPVSKSR